MSEVGTRTLPLEKTAPDLARHVARVRRRMGTVAWQTGLTMAAPIILGWLALVMPLDSRFELSRGVRAIFLCAGLGAAGAVWWYFGLRIWRRRPDEDRVALAIERAVPIFRSRFIVCVQLARRPEDEARPLVRALVRQTSELADRAELDEVVSTVRLFRWLKICTGAAVVATVLWLLGGTDSWPLFQRAWLASVPVPRETQIMAYLRERVVAKGDDVRIEARVAGLVPKSGVLHIEIEGKPTQHFTLDADPGGDARFFRTLQSVQEGFTYWMELGDNHSARGRVRVRPRPAIAQIECEQRWPAYTKFPPQRRLVTDLKLLAGSKLAVRIKPTAVLSEARLQLVGGDRTQVVKEVELEADLAVPGAVTEWSGVVEIPAKEASGMTLQLVDEEGVESKGMALYRLEIVPDQPPTLRVTWPIRREELATTRATLLVGFEAKDDFGLSQVQLHYSVNWHEAAPHSTISLEIGDDEPKVLTRRFEWNLARLQPPINEGDVLDFWFEARDANNVTGPGIATMAEHYQVRVVSDEEKRADLDARLNDTLQGLNDVKTSQEDLAQRLGELIREK